MTDEEAFMEAAFDLSYDIADWLIECAAHFFHVRFLRDKHDVLWIASKCMDLRRFAPLPRLDESEDDDAYEDMKEPFKQILVRTLEEKGWATGRPYLQRYLRASYEVSCQHEEGRQRLL